MYHCLNFFIFFFTLCGMDFWIFAETLGIYYISCTKSFSGTSAVILCFFFFFQRKYLPVLAGMQHGYKAGIWISVFFNSEPEFFVTIKENVHFYEVYPHFKMAASYPWNFLSHFFCSRSPGGAWEFSSLTHGPVPDHCGRCWALGCVWEPVSALSRAPCVEPQDLFCTCTLRSLATNGTGGTDFLMGTALSDLGSSCWHSDFWKDYISSPKIIKKVYVFVHYGTVLKREAVVSGHACDANFNTWETRYKVFYPWDKGRWDSDGEVCSSWWTN